MNFDLLKSPPALNKNGDGANPPVTTVKGNENSQVEITPGIEVPTDALQGIEGIENFATDEPTNVTDTNTPTGTETAEPTPEKGKLRGIAVPLINVKGELYAYNVVTKGETYNMIGKSVLPKDTPAFAEISFDIDSTKETGNGRPVLVNITVENATEIDDVLTNNANSVLPTVTVETTTDFIARLINATDLPTALTSITANATNFTTSNLNGLTVVVTAHATTNS